MNNTVEATNAQKKVDGNSWNTMFDFLTLVGLVRR